MPRRTWIATALFAAVLCTAEACLVDVDPSRIATSTKDAGSEPGLDGAPADAAIASDASGDGSVYAGMPCGSGTCLSPRACCLLTEGTSDPKGGVCQAGDGECASNDLFRCMGPNDCGGGGTVCCVKRDPDLIAACSTSCSDTILCDVAHGCPAPKACGPSDEYPGLFTCQ